MERAEKIERTRTARDVYEALIRAYMRHDRTQRVRDYTAADMFGAANREAARGDYGVAVSYALEACEMIGASVSRELSCAASDLGR